MTDQPLSLSCFKAYDVRGRLGTDIETTIARRIGRAFAQVMDARRVVLGRDARASSPGLSDAVAEGLVAAGVEVLDIGLCGTEEVYFATSHLDADGGIEITASHNPIDYNGMKMVRRGSAPVDAARDMPAMRALAESGAFAAPVAGGRVVPAQGVRAAYVDRVLSFVDVAALRPLTILVNAGNGAAGPTFDALADGLAQRGAPLRFVRMHHEPDATFPNGIPNPILPENQPATAEALRAAGADMGVAWDGDFDRCFFFDHQGRFIAGEYVVGLLAAAYLAKEPGATIVHDPRLIWNTQDVVAAGGGRAVMAKTGHVFLKSAMRETGAVYGGEMSAHHYFRDFLACDSGMIPWLLVAELIGRSGQTLADLLAARIAAFPSSGEINFTVADSAACVARVHAALSPEALSEDRTDGMSLIFPDWRLSLRSSNTEPLLRLNVESRGRPDRVAEAVARITDLIRSA
jgi:phosphomannomutase